MTKAKPLNLAASVRQRLMNLSRSRNEDFQLVLTRYALERLLYRLSQSEHRGVFVLKGAMLFQLWGDHPHRPTRDVDLLGHGDISIPRFQRIFREVCELAVEEDGLVFSRTRSGAARSRRISSTRGCVLPWSVGWKTPGFRSRSTLASVTW